MSIATRDHHRSAAESRSENSDSELLRAFVSTGDDLVFAQLVTRHAGLVMGVCRRVLGNEQDAEDAFQATFLVLARKAGSLKNGKSLPAWLHRTAHRIALRARANKARRREQSFENEAMVEDRLTLQRIAAEHDRTSLDEELNRLPQRYRLPLFLCCIEGKTRDEAARQLGWSLGSLKGRLERARQLLRHRLLLRGVSLSAATALVMSGQAMAQSPVPPSLVVSTVQAGIRFAAGRSPVGYVAPLAHSLANWSLQTMSITLLKYVAGPLLVIGTATASHHWLVTPAAAESESHGARVLTVAAIDTVAAESTFVAFAEDDREEGERRPERERAEACERREDGERRELPGEVRERLEQLKRRHAELREAGKVEEARAVEREFRHLLERVQAAQRDGDARREGSERREDGERQEDGERRELPGEVRERLEQLKRRHAELREAGKVEEARAVEREFRHLLERVQAAQRDGDARREGGERRELPGEVRERLEQLKRRHAELREAGKIDEARAVEREIQRLLRRFHAARPEGEPREGEVGERLRHLRAAVEHLRAAGLHDLAAQAAEQTGRLEREFGERRDGDRREGDRRDGDRREGEAREREEHERRDADVRERREREQDQPREREERRDRE